jgi:hypothetical protein
MPIVEALRRDAGEHVLDPIVREGHVLHDGPGGGTVLIPGREDDRGAPVVLERVSVDQHALGRS